MRPVGLRCQRQPCLHRFLLIACIYGQSVAQGDALPIRISKSPMGETDGRLDRMTRILALSLALAAAVSTAGCETPQQSNALGGAVLGGAGGALIGSAVSHGSAGGALAGGAIGAATGAMLGSAATPPGPYAGPPPGPYYGAPPPPRRCAQWAYDYNGNQVCTAFY
jgi:hypothetical protein